jgi:phosphoribosylformylglycinamidine cyclo-ligase
LDLIGRYGEKAKVQVNGICHVTGGGIPGNLPRIFKNNKCKTLGAKLDNLFPPSDWISELIKLGKVSEAEARAVWNLGNGMLITLPQREVTSALKLLKKAKIQARVAGEINASGKITF